MKRVPDLKLSPRRAHRRLKTRFWFRFEPSVRVEDNKRLTVRQRLQEKDVSDEQLLELYYFLEDLENFKCNLYVDKLVIAPFIQYLYIGSSFLDVCPRSGDEWGNQYFTTTSARLWRNSQRLLF